MRVLVFKQLCFSIAFLSSHFLYAQPQNRKRKRDESKFCSSFRLNPSQSHVQADFRGRFIHMEEDLLSRMQHNVKSNLIKVTLDIYEFFRILPHLTVEESSNAISFISQILNSINLDLIYLQSQPSRDESMMENLRESQRIFEGIIIQFEKKLNAMGFYQFHEEIHDSFQTIQAQDEGESSSNYSLSVVPSEEDDGKEKGKEEEHEDEKTEVDDGELLNQNISRYFSDEAFATPTAELRFPLKRPFPLIKEFVI